MPWRAPCSPPPTNSGNNCLAIGSSKFVIPAKAGIHRASAREADKWVPAFGTTKVILAIRKTTSTLAALMSNTKGIWAVVPVKDTSAAKQRLAAAVPARLRQALMLAMLEDVLAALAETRGLAGRLLVTTDPAAQRLATRYGADWLTDGAADGHTR